MDNILNDIDLYQIAKMILSIHDTPFNGKLRSKYNYPLNYIYIAHTPNIDQR